MGSKHLTTRNRTKAELDAIYKFTKALTVAHVVQMCHAVKLETDLTHCAAPQDNSKCLHHQNLCELLIEVE